MLLGSATEARATERAAAVPVNLAAATLGALRVCNCTLEQLRRQVFGPKGGSVKQQRQLFEAVRVLDRAGQITAVPTADGELWTLTATQRLIDVTAWRALATQQLAEAMRLEPRAHVCPDCGSVSGAQSSGF